MRTSILPSTPPIAPRKTILRRLRKIIRRMLRAVHLDGAARLQRRELKRIACNARNNKHNYDKKYRRHVSESRGVYSPNRQRYRRFFKAKPVNTKKQEARQNYKHKDVQSRNMRDYEHNKNHKHYHEHEQEHSHSAHKHDHKQNLINGDYRESKHKIFEKLKHPNKALFIEESCKDLNTYEMSSNDSRNRKSHSGYEDNRNQILEKSHWYHRIGRRYRNHKSHKNYENFENYESDNHKNHKHLNHRSHRSHRNHRNHRNHSNHRNHTYTNRNKSHGESRYNNLTQCRPPKSMENFRRIHDHNHSRENNKDR